MLVSDLEDFGLSEVEAKIYLAVLELGVSFVSHISKKAKVARVNSYYILDSLVKRGFLNSFTRNGLKYYAVENPQVLVNKQEEKFKKAKKLLPELLSITNTLAYKPKIRYYEGLEGIINIFEDTLNTKHEMIGYTNLANLPSVLTEEYLKNYAKRKIERKIKTRMLSPISDNALKYLENYYPKDYDKNLVEVFFIDPKQFSFKYEINIYEDKTAIISLNPEELIGIIIESNLYSETQRSIFNLAWLGATSFVVR